MPQPSKDAIALEFAGFWRRLGAYIIDAIVLLAIFSLFEPFHIPGFSKLWEMTSSANPATWMTRFDNFSSPGAVVLSGFYFVAFWVARGQTLGMMAAAVKVMRSDGTDVDAGHGIVRYFGYLVSIIPLFLGFIWIAFDPHKQGWHDKIADTVVVKIPAAGETAKTATPPTAAI